jgi:hypothetical protein
MISKVKNLFLDFKRSANNGTGGRLHDRDRKNLAKALSGFGNSAGGVIVWGRLSRSPHVGDLAATKFPVEDPKRFVSRLEGAIPGCTIPSHADARYIRIATPDSNAGFVVTYVAKRYAPASEVLAIRGF